MGNRLKQIRQHAIRILNPCLIYDSSALRLLSASERMQFYEERTRIADFSPVGDWDIRNPGLIRIGMFAGGKEGREGVG